METQHWLDEACACNYVGRKQAEELKDELMIIGRMINSMMGKIKLFCGQSTWGVHDETSEYVA